MSSMIFISLFVVTSDRILNSKCGLSCGFEVENHHTWNPLDFLLVSRVRFSHWTISYF